MIHFVKFARSDVALNSLVCLPGLASCAKRNSKAKRKEQSGLHYYVCMYNSVLYQVGLVDEHKMRVV